MNKVIDKADTGAREQLRTCFDAGDLGELVANARNQPSTSQVLQTCATSSSPWQGWVVDVTATKVPADQCAALQSDINASINSCKSSVDAILNSAKIAGIVIGSAAVLCLIVGGSYYAYKKCSNSEPARPSMV